MFLFCVKTKFSRAIDSQRHQISDPTFIILSILNIFLRYLDLLLPASKVPPSVELNTPVVELTSHISWVGF